MAFDEETHTYHAKGRTFPSVTQLVAGENSFWTEEGRARGKAIHAWSARLDVGESITLAHLPEAWRGYARALLAFYDDIRPTWVEIEQARINVRRGYGGRRDRVGVVLGGVAIVDFKTGSVEEHHGPQLAGYDMLDDGPLGRRALFGVYLQANGRYKLREYADRLSDRARFTKALDDYHKRATIRNVREI